MTQDVSTQADSFDTSVKEAVSSSTCERLKEPAYVTTITVCVALSKEVQNIYRIVDAYKEAMASEDHVMRTFVDSVFGGADNFYPKKLRENQTDDKKLFLNCVIFTLNIPDTKGVVSVKCFTNGNLHITGVKSIRMALTVAESFCMFFSLIDDAESIVPSYSVQDFTVQLINAHFALDVENGGLKLDKLFKLLLEKTEHLSMYNSDRHAGVMVKMLMDNMKTVTIIVFDTGNILICAFCSSEEYLLAWQFITSFISKHWRQIWSDRKLPHKHVSAKKKSGFDYGKYIILK